MRFQVQKVDTHKFCLESNGTNNELLIRSIMNAIPGSYTNPTYTQCTFYANSITSLETLLREKKLLSYNKTLHFLFYLSKQQTFLEKKLSTFYNLSPKDILVIDESKFICINPLTVEQYTTNHETILFNKPFPRNEFSSPEMNAINSLPCQLSFKTGYYSLGALAFFCLTGDTITDKSIHPIYNVSNQVASRLHCIEYTKLYWVLLKSLCQDPTNRTLIFI
jgi:hypothetical protein